MSISHYIMEDNEIFLRGMNNKSHPANLLRERTVTFFDFLTHPISSMLHSALSVNT